MKITDKQKKMLIGGGIAGIALLALSSGGDKEGGFGGGGGGMTHGSTPLLGDAGKKETSATAPITNIFYPEAPPFTPDMSWFTDDGNNGGSSGPVKTSPVFNLDGRFNLSDEDLKRYTLGPTPGGWMGDTQTMDLAPSKKEKVARAEVGGRAGLIPTTITMSDAPAPTEAKKGSVSIPKTGNIYTDAAASAIGGFSSIWSKLSLWF